MPCQAWLAERSKALSVRLRRDIPKDFFLGWQYFLIYLDQAYIAPHTDALKKDRLFRVVMKVRASHKYVSAHGITRRVRWDTRTLDPPLGPAPSPRSS